MAIRHTIVMLSIVLAASGYALPEARAEFQALGVVATKQAVPLQCQNGLCTAYLSTFCLEQNRPPPPNQTRYRLDKNTKVTLIVERADGGILRLPGRDWLRFETRTNYTGVLASIDVARLDNFNAVKMSVEVGAMASLLPVPTKTDDEEPAKTDDNPHNAAEIALATGPYRRAAQDFFETGPAGTGAASFSINLINALPISGNVSEQRQKDIVATALAAFNWAGASHGSRAEVDRLIARCQVPFPRRWHMSMRLCLEHEHGTLQVSTNNRFWKSLGGV
jgi:hypothetical protein